mgnify:CR=1 FL=1
MIYVNITFLFAFAAIFIISVRRSSGEWKNTIDHRENKLYFLYPMADLILTRARLYKKLNRKDQTVSSIKALNVTGNQEFVRKVHWCGKVSLVLFILLLTNVLSVLGQLGSQNKSEILSGGYLIRPEAGAGGRAVDLNVTMDRNGPGGSASSEELSRQSEDVTLNIGARKYTQKELATLFGKAKEYLDQSILGNNEDGDHIYENLYFCDTIPGTGISVEWEPEDTKLVDWDGVVHNEKLETGGRDVVISAVLTCQDMRIDYEKKLRIMPKRYSRKEQLHNLLEQEINTALNSNAEEKWIKLPKEAGGYRLSWKDKKQNSSIQIFFLGILTVICIWFYQDRELVRKMKARKEQMLLDYPEIINKFTLFINAGMTVRQAWCRITQDYEDKRKAGRSTMRYAYEEMQVTACELNLGIPEGDAFEQFGKRTGVIPFMKFGSLIAQNLKKGNKGISELLMKEAADAFEERKETAKRLGEEAGTKLLAPMMIMLVIVFAIILVPAFLSFHM